MIVEDFRTGTTGTGVPHLPEIVFIKTGEPFGTHAHFFQPDIRGFIIRNMHRDPQPLFRQAQGARQEFPRELDGFALEVVTEAEVTQHFKEGVVTGGITHIFQIVVLATGANTAL